MSELKRLEGEIERIKKDVAEARATSLFTHSLLSTAFLTLVQNSMLSRDAALKMLEATRAAIMVGAHELIDTDPAIRQALDQCAVLREALALE